MAQIPPIDDAYINEIIKSNGPYNPALLTTQGLKLRELIKLLRDRMEQGDNEAVHKTGDESISGTKTFTLIKAEGLSVNNLADPSLNTVISPVTGVQTKLLNVTDGAFGVQLSASVLAASRSQLLQDKDGVVALTSNLSSLEEQLNIRLGFKIDDNQRGVPGGVSTLDSGGKILTSQLPDSISGALTYQGTWDATINSPMLADPPASFTKGYYYVTNVAGAQFGLTFAVGDWVVSNGTEWQKVDNTDSVVSVFGRLGNILANEADYSAFYPALSDRYADPSWITSLAYSKITGAPDLTSYVPYTGATTNVDLGINSLSANLITINGLSSGGGLWAIRTVGTKLQFLSSLASAPFSIDENTEDAVFTNDVTALSFIKTGGTAAQFLKADGSVDSNTYVSQSAIEFKQDMLFSGGNIKTINGESLLGSGDLSISSGGVTTIGAIGSTPNANGATIANNTLILQPASDIFGGVITTKTQTISGAKIFSSDLTVKGITVGQGSGDGRSNVAFGIDALVANVSSINNIAIGGGALRANLTGINNTAMGAGALNFAVASSNTAIGHTALFSTTTGGANTAVGSDALYGNKTGTYNAAIGLRALSSNTTGYGNTAIGSDALNLNKTGNSLTAIGYGANVTTDALENASAIGFNAKVNASNKIQLGDPSVTLVNTSGAFQGSQFRLSALNIAPVSATAPGTIGEIRVTSTFIYVCIATNSWVRSALTTW